MLTLVAILFVTFWSAETNKLTVFQVTVPAAQCEAVKRATAQADIPGELWIKAECLPAPVEGGEEV